jgi:broad specificity phosphatase PhoE
MQTIYLARHAAPDRFKPGFIYHRLPGPPLTETGLQEAEALGAYLRSCGAGRIYASPFERCQQTARTAADIAGIPWETDDTLGEVQPNDKSENTLERVRPAFDRILTAHRNGSPPVLVTHGGVIGVLLGYLGVDAETLKGYQFDYGNPLPPAGVWLARRLEDDQPWDLHLAFQPESAPVSA